jgi:hypothetical protein
LPPFENTGELVPAPETQPAEVSGDPIVPAS